MKEPPACATLADCRNHEGERIRAIGEYVLHDPYPVRKKDSGLPLLVRLKMEDTEKGPFLEPFWHPGSVRPPEEQQRCIGKKVEVVGTFYAQQPTKPGEPAQASSFGGPCIHPVESVEVAQA